jgi:hypothetical protein
LVADIGIMIAAYIVTRMTEILTAAGARLIVCAFAGLTILITVLAAADLLTHGLPSQTLGR